MAVFAGVCIGLVFLIYVWNFGIGFATKKDEWGQFGDYMGGTLNPILSFMGLIALLRTLALQNQQLELSAIAIRQSQEELTLTRMELQRTAAAQERSAELQVDQAEHTAIAAKIAALGLANDQVTKMLTNLVAVPAELLTEEDESNKKMLAEIRAVQIAQMFQISTDLCGTKVASNKKPSG